MVAVDHAAVALRRQELRHRAHLDELRLLARLVAGQLGLRERRVQQDVGRQVERPVEVVGEGAGHQEANSLVALAFTETFDAIASCSCAICCEVRVAVPSLMFAAVMTASAAAFGGVE